MREKQELLLKLSDQVLEMEEDGVKDTAREYLEAGYPVLQGIMDGLIDGMNRAGELYEEEEYFVTDLLLCSDAMYNGLEILKPHLPETGMDQKIKAVIGVVEGDTHDIGKNLVKIMLETAGFEITDLGKDVPARRFVDVVKEKKAELLCLSTLMTTTMTEMKEIIDMLSEEGIRESVKVMVGGGAVTLKFADKIGADGYSSNAVEAVKLAKKLAGIAK